MSIRCTCLSDIHGRLPLFIPQTDLLLIGGDLCPVDNHTPEYQVKWINNQFTDWLYATRNKYKCCLFIAGNHDFVFQRNANLIDYRSLADSCNAHYLQDTSDTFNGLKVWGTPWQPEFCNWAFNLTEPELKKKWDLIPDDVNVIIVHGPPYGYGDLTCDNRNTGSPSLTEKIKYLSNKKLRLVVTGHIHESRGQWLINSTIIANCSVVNEDYRRTREPMTFTL